MPVLTVKGQTPKLADTVYLAPSAYLIGEVTAGEKSSFWFNVTVRGDVAPITIGKETSIQDGVVIHGCFGKHRVQIGDRVTVGHQVVLHGCTVGSHCLIGMSSTLMDGVQVGSHCIVAAGSLLTPGSEYPEGQLILGRPAKAVRKLTEDELEWIEKSADNYLHYQTWYKED